MFCRRYEDAADAAAGLLPGADRAYLEAQAAWRWGRLQQAQAILDQAELKDSFKCRELHTLVSRLHAAEAEAREALEDGAQYLHAVGSDLSAGAEWHSWKMSGEHDGKLRK